MSDSNTFSASPIQADFARCAGVGDDASGFRDGCSDCLRRTAPPTDHPRVAHMAPPEFITFFCPYYLPERDDRTGDMFGPSSEIGG